MLRRYEGNGEGEQKRGVVCVYTKNISPRTGYAYRRRSPTAKAIDWTLSRKYLPFCIFNYPTKQKKKIINK